MTVIAIDGPSGSGKSTISRLLAHETHLPYLDTGAMYRALALFATQSGIDLRDAALMEKCADDMQLDLTNEGEQSELKQRVFVNGVDVTFDIRTKEISQASSVIAVHPGVRERLVQRQRDWVAQHTGGVVEGRDIGSVVFPDATLKVFLTASEEERAKRRRKDIAAPEFAELSHADTQKEMAKRDARDSNREASPLQATPDAVIVDTSSKDIHEVVDTILDELRKRVGGTR
jgi:cytidylate kinase